MSNHLEKDCLWTKDFIFITFVNLFTYLIHYMLVVTITEYTIDKYHASESIGGLAAGIFIIGMLAGRLGSGSLYKKVLLYLDLLLDWYLTTI